MKKIVCLLLIAMLTMPTLAYAIDMDALKKAPGVKVTIDEMDDSIDVSPTLELSDLLAIADSSFVALSPDIISIEYDNDIYYILRLQFVIVTNDSTGITPDGIILKIGSKRYSISGDGKVIGTDENTMEQIIIPFVEDGLDAIKAIATNITDVKVRICGVTDINFTLTKNQQTAIKDVYNAYVAAGCLEQDNMDVFEALYPVTVK